MSDLTEAYEYYKKAWERQLAEATSELRAENARLREALKKLAVEDFPDGTDGLSWFEKMDAQYLATEMAHVVRLAREALKG
ncbi:MAG: hypothetical protein EBX40_02110 [Gammaproteobacteria bacterium]|nr:hypothetical protein [Gammaproteobacteria bacterium]